MFKKNKMENNQALLFQFNKDCNPIDLLIESFEKQGWVIQRNLNSAYFHKYYWPDIILSGKKLKDFSEDNYGDIDLMGCYKTEGNNWLLEGQVILYYEVIKKVADKYVKEELPKSSDDMGYSEEINETILLLSKIVMYHEFVHWIMHWIESPQLSENKLLSRKYIPIQYTEQDNIEFHEAFAQLFTKFFCEEDSKRKKIFEWLEKGQTPPYRKYKELNDCNEEKAILILTLLKDCESQSFNDAKFYSKIDFNDVINKNISLSDFTKSNRGQILSHTLDI